MIKPESPEQSTLLIILGASDFPYSTYTGSKGFENAANMMTEYFLDKEGFNLNPKNFRWLFNADLDPLAILNNISEFIKRRKDELIKEGIRLTDLIIYYVGHGAFDNHDNYCLVIKKTNNVYLSSSSIPINSLYQVIADSALWIRSILILDSCFSAAAALRIQGGPLDVIKRNLNASSFPTRGISLLASSSKNNVSMLTDDGNCTMFAKALVSTLKMGSSQSKYDRLSLKDIHFLLREKMRELFLEQTINPEIHSPKQPEGEVADVCLFPNQALIQYNRIINEERARHNRIESENIIREENERVKREEEEKETNSKDASAKNNDLELNIKYVAKSKNDSYGHPDDNIIDIYTQEACSKENREPLLNLIDPWLENKIKKFIVKKLQAKMKIKELKSNIEELSRRIYNLKDDLRIKKGSGESVYYSKQGIARLTNEIKTESSILFTVEQEYINWEDQEKMYSSILAGPLRSKVLNMLKENRQKGDTVSFAGVMDSIQLNTKKENNRNKWVLAIQAISLVISLIAFMIYFIVIYIPWVYNLQDNSTYLKFNLRNKINVICSLLTIILFNYFLVSYLLKTIINSLKGTINFKEVYAGTVQMLFILFSSMTLFSFLPWSWKLLNNTSDYLNKIGLVAPWLASLFILIIYISIFQSIARPFLKLLKKQNKND